MTPIQRKDNRGGVRSGYRLGPARNARLQVGLIMPLAGLMT